MTRPIGTAATTWAPARVSAEAALCRRAPMVKVSSTKRTRRPLTLSVTAKPVLCAWLRSSGPSLTFEEGRYWLASGRASVTARSSGWSPSWLLGQPNSGSAVCVLEHHLDGAPHSALARPPSTNASPFRRQTGPRRTTLVVLMPAPALAARQPTLTERAAITAALPADFKRYPVGCVFLRTAASNNGHYATVTPVILNGLQQPCVKYGSNGHWILRKTTRWKIVFEGSVSPPCSLRVPRDLARYTP
jgi:hypothetical protein